MTALELAELKMDIERACPQVQVELDYAPGSEKVAVVVVPDFPEQEITWIGCSGMGLFHERDGIKSYGPDLVMAGVVRKVTDSGLLFKQPSGVS